MLRHPTLAALEALKLTGMATALMEQLEMPEAVSYTHLTLPTSDLV